MDKMNIKFLSPNETEWKVIKPDSEEQEEKTACDKNKRVLNELFCSSMQMQNIVVLSGSGTSLGDAGGPSIADLWKNCTKEKGKYTETTNKIAKTISYDISDEKKSISKKFCHYAKLFYRYIKIVKK